MVINNYLYIFVCIYTLGSCSEQETSMGTRSFAQVLVQNKYLQ